MSSPRQSGKISLLSVAVAAIFVMIIASLFLAKEDPQAVGAQFMDALARHDVDKLTELSFTGKTDPQEVAAEKKKLHDQWDFCVNVAGQHFGFLWKVSAATLATDNHGSVTVMLTKAGPSSYEEKYELPLEKEGGRWVIDAGAISRNMFTGLPSG